ncbi:SDR family NAD(P)-dependent oxidoreductase [Lacibacter sp. MH-610]|uniref:SDR family NAD(P)-dependent oxidoreductase n=1 Tax=Lacibacter sp. MH-610 TaxID=3020883 RepID=UPI0038925C73
MSKKKIAIITGATGNLGLAVTKKFIAEGYKVIGTAVPDDATPMNFHEDEFEKVVVDLLNEEAAAEFIASVIKKHGTIDTTVLTVGGFAMGRISETSSGDLMKQYKLNFETTYHIARPVFVQMMKQNKGRMFFIGARPGLSAVQSENMTAYGFAKSLVVRLAELINIEARGKNVVASVVIPSTIDTPQNRKAMPEADFNNWVKPEDIANIIYYHSTDEAHALRETIIKVYNNC